MKDEWLLLDFVCDSDIGIIEKMLNPILYVCQIGLRGEIPETSFSEIGYDMSPCYKLG